MKPGIRFSNEWTDEDMVELHIEICDGRSLFATRVYVGHQQLRNAVKDLEAFKHQIYGGIFNLRFGEFGPEYASGAFDARLQFREQGKILIRASAQSEFASFDGREFAGETTLYLVSEPALLDEFVRTLNAMSEARGEHAELDGIVWN